jgi:spectinomycin phosphotransferase
MMMPNDRIDELALTAMLEGQYCPTVGPLHFQPVGADSWNYRAGPLWVSVRRDFEGHFAACYEAALELSARGLDFVVPPLAGRDGRVVHVVGRFPVVVSRYLDARPLGAGPDAGPAELEAVATMAHRLHRASVAAGLPVEDYRFPLAGALDEALSAVLRGRPAAGPFSHRLRRLVAGSRHAIAEMADELRALGLACRGAGHELVLTHGDLVPGNVVRHGGRLLLADWTGAMWAPPERDWYHLTRTFGIRARVDADLTRYYELRWALTEIAEYVIHFLGEHAGTIDDEIAWRELLRSVPGAAMVPAS